MVILPVLILMISINLVNFYNNIGKIHEKYNLILQKVWVEDCLSAITLKVKNFFPIRFERNMLIYKYNKFALGYVVNKTNTILANYSGEWYCFNFSDNFDTIYHNLTSNYYAFRFEEPFRVTYLQMGKRRFRATYSFYYKNTLVYRRRVDNGTFIVTFWDGKNLTIYHSSLTVSNPYRKDFIMRFDKDLDLKILLWWVEIERGKLHYEGYIRWR